DAGQACPHTQNTCFVSQDVQIRDPTDAPITPGTRALLIKRGNTLRVAPGNLVLVAGSVTLEPSAHIATPGNGSVGGRLTITSSGDVRVQADPDGSSQARLDSTSGIQAGDLSVTAVGDVVVDGIVDVKAEDANGHGG